MIESPACPSASLQGRGHIVVTIKLAYDEQIRGRRLGHILDKRLAALHGHGDRSVICGGLKGIEKESLRITTEGRIAQTSHPPTLGSALTNPYITTDFSEALLELVTPPQAETSAALAFLDDIHRFVYTNIGDELLWATSMPCAVTGEKSVPIAEYGTSNVGRMKHVYRRGLSHRYGRVMQAIAGVHFNYSLPDDFWPAYQEIQGDRRVRQEFIDTCYFALLRNFHRFGWITLFLFGASPAICKSFLCGRPSELADFDAYTGYEEFATSLRMSDLGYKNKSQASVGLSVNRLDEYISGLKHAVSTPFPAYENIGVRVDGEYRQLNANLLQIENEYYSLIRPKRVAFSGERPTQALVRGGVQYVEIRALDVSPCDADGVSASQLRFLEAFLIYCLLADSPPVDAVELEQIEQNQLAVARNGRDPGLRLVRGERGTALTEWASEIVADMSGVCELLDRDRDDDAYATALAEQRAKIEDPDQTPSARILSSMREHGEPFFTFGMRMSRQHRDHFVSGAVGESQVLALLRESVARSIEKQKAIEASDRISFEEYLENYFGA